MSSKEAWIERIARWVERPSGTFDELGVRGMAETLVEAVRPLSDELEVLEQRPVETWSETGERVVKAIGPLIVARRRRSAPRQVLLGIHYDTVYPIDHAVRTCHREGDRLIGPGAADAKGGIAVMLAALERFESGQAGNELGWELFLNADEEIGSPVSREYFAGCGGRFDFAMLYDPTVASGAMVSRRTGAGNFIAVLHGRAAHAGRDIAAGRNAVVAAARIADRWSQLNAAFGSSTFNVGRLQGGGALNIVPDLASVGLNVRIDRADQVMEVETQVRKVAEDVAKESEVELILSGGITSPPKEIDAAQRRLMAGVEKIGQRLGMVMDWVETGGVCDGNKLAAYGVPNLDSFGVRGDRIHSSEEWMSVSSFEERVALSVGVLETHAREGLAVGRGVDG